MNELVELENIKRLKYRYMRAVDTKDWALLEQLFTPDAVSWYDGGKYRFEGRDKILEFLSGNMGRLITLHQVHHPEIELVTEDSATGVWYLQDYVINLDHNWELMGAALYEDEYIRVDGAWKIRSTGYHRTFEETRPRGEGIRTQDRWGIADSIAD